MLNDPKFIILTVVITVSFMAFIFSLMRRMNKKKREKLAMIAASLGAEFNPGSWKEQPSMKGELGGRKYEISFHVVSSGNSSTTYLDLKTVIKPTEMKLVIKKVDFGVKLFKKIGLSKRLSSGDHYFDEKVSISGTPEQQVLSLLYGPYFKDAVIKLTTRGYTTIANNSELILSKVYSAKKDMDVVVLRQDLDALVNLAEIVEEQH